ncbi:MAG TPA: S9 family peptidase [Flavobacterium sp.]|nr:S9 family peptidase [Flavobacterium sp.]
MNFRAISFLFLLISSSLVAQDKLTLAHIWSGVFRTQDMQELQAMQNTNQYTVLEYKRSTRAFEIDLYDFKTLNKVSTIFSTRNFPKVSSIDTYSFDKDENQLLMATNSESIYRHSFVADFFIYDRQTNTIKAVSDKKIQEPVFSPDGKSLVYVFENNIYSYDIASGSETQITTDGKKNQRINGITDWVYEEEFAFVRAFDISKNGSYLAYIKFDETQVPEFSMDIYGTGLYPTQQVFKYPKAGEKNSEVSLYIYDFASKSTQKINLGDYTDFYIPRIKWTNIDEQLSVQVINRHQNHLDLHLVNAKDASTKIILTEKDDSYVDVTDDLTFLEDNSFIWTSEKDGYNHIYHYNANGKLKNQVTKGNWEVTKYYGYNPKSKTVFYQSVENGSINRDVYSIGLNGKNNLRLSSQTGTNTATFSPDYSLFVNAFSSTTEPTKYTLNEVKSGKEIKTIVENTALKNRLQPFDLPQKEFFELTTEKGHVLNTWMIKPKNFDPSKKYPVLMHQYSGPGSQQVKNSWNSIDDYFHFLLSQEGYIIVCVDGRGTGYKGAAFKKVTYKELGKYEVEDQIDAAKTIGNYPYIDKNRIGIWGWSYGGFMSSNCILKANDVFSLAIAVAPVTSWRFYDTIYTERYMQTPQENPSGYDQNSPLFFADQLKGDYLIIHGSSDDNVHVQNTMLMVDALIQKNKQFEWAIYPDKNHGIYGGATRLQLYTKIKNFITEKL